MNKTLEEMKLRLVPPPRTSEPPTTMAQRTVYVQVTGLPPLRSRPGKWWSRVTEQLDNLVALPANWDSYGADPVESDIVGSAMGFLLGFGAALDLPEPRVAPTRIGGVLLQWSSHQKSVEVEFVSPDAVSYVYADEASGQEFEGELFRDDEDHLQSVLGQRLKLLC